MTKLEAGMTREEAFALLADHNKDPFHIEHGETSIGKNTMTSPRSIRFMLLR